MGHSSRAWPIAVIALASCRTQSGESETVAASALTATTATITVSVPRNIDVGGCVLAAGNSVTLFDRSVVSDPICNVGGGGTTIGVDARTAAVLTRSALVTRDRAFVNGKVETTVAVQKAPTSTIVGPIDTHATFDPVGTETRTVVFPAAPDVDVTLVPDQIASRDPGRYRNLTIATRARLNLRSGTYYFESMGVIEPQAVIALDERSGPVVIYVKQPFVFRGAVVSNIGQPDWLIGVTGTGTVSIEAPFQGSILAPGCRIVIGTGETSHSGAFAARDIELQPGVRVTFRPSSELRPGSRPTCPLTDDFVGTALSPAWRTFDVGAPAGSTVVNNQLRITGGGPGLTGTRDGVRFLHQSASGDVDLAVQVASVGTSSGFGGLMLRSDLSAASAFVALGVSGSGAVSFKRRTGSGQTATSQQVAAATPPFPVWLRLSKEGTSVTAYRSTDGLTWQAVATATVAFPSAFHVGVASSSSAAGASSQAVFQGFGVPFAGDCGKCVAGGSP
ncbi:MAG TPA: hypothetical protein VIQ54_13885 [Polyangia bacterium]